MLYCCFYRLQRERKFDYQEFHWRYCGWLSRINNSKILCLAMNVTKEVRNLLPSCWYHYWSSWSEFCVCSCLGLIKKRRAVPKASLQQPLQPCSSEYQVLTALFSYSLHIRVCGRCSYLPSHIPTNSVSQCTRGFNYSWIYIEHQGHCFCCWWVLCAVTCHVVDLLQLKHLLRCW